MLYSRCLEEEDYTYLCLYERKPLYNYQQNPHFGNVNPLIYYMCPPLDSYTQMHINYWTSSYLRERIALTLLLCQKIHVHSHKASSTLYCLTSYQTPNQGVVRDSWYNNKKAINLIEAFLMSTHNIPFSI